MVKFHVFVKSSIFVMLRTRNQHLQILSLDNFNKKLTTCGVVFSHRTFWRSDFLIIPEKWPFDMFSFVQISNLVKIRPLSFEISLSIGLTDESVLGQVPERVNEGIEALKNAVTLNSYRVFACARMYRASQRDRYTSASATTAGRHE